MTYLRRDGEPAVPPYIYFLSVGNFVKIGITDAAVIRRMDQIQCANPLPVTLLALIEGNRADEIRWHKALAEDWVRGEWFNLSAKATRLIHDAQSESLVVWHRKSGTTTHARRRRKTFMGDIQAEVAGLTSPARSPVTPI